jgi:hypothetical protein
MILNKFGLFYGLVGAILNHFFIVSVTPYFLSGDNTIKDMNYSLVLLQYFIPLIVGLLIYKSYTLFFSSLHSQTNQNNNNNNAPD